MKKTIFFFCVFLYGLFAQNLSDEFRKYPIKVYKGEIKIPSIYRYEKEWEGYLDKDDNPVGEIKVINFADRYRVVHHFCGTGCGSYSLIDLSTGEEDFEIFKEFSDSDEDRIATGKITFYKLHTKAGSTFLVSSRITEGFCDEDCGDHQKQYLIKTSRDGKKYLEEISDYEPCIDNKSTYTTPIPDYEPCVSEVDVSN